jgi:RNA polymerase sigma-70 factor (ECF subfamily)
MRGRHPDRSLTELLVLRAQTGDRRAFAQLYRLWAPRLQAHVARTAADVHAALDISQETWLGIARALPRLDDPASFAPWAYRIATRKAADWTRTRIRDRRIGEDAAPRPQPEPASDDTDRIRDAINRLPPDRRAILSMHYADSLTLMQIACALQIPVGTVKSRLHAARAELKHILEHSSPRR